MRTHEDIEKEARLFVERCISRKARALIVTLSGELGAGKTAFVQAIAKVFGVLDTVTSPTFVVEKVYELPTDTARGFARLVHIDAYRLTGSKELEMLGWQELIAESSNLIFLEWPERVLELIPSDAIRTELKHLENETHSLSYEFQG